MINVIILHGIDPKTRYLNPSKPSAANSHWLPWLKKQLIAHELKADTPEVYKPYRFEYDSWVREIERFDIGPETILVGHSMGAGFLLKYLNVNTHLKIKKLILVAPWLNVSEGVSTDFFKFKIDTNLHFRVEEIVIFNSKDDSQGVQDSVEFIKNDLKTKLIEFEERGHFAKGQREFPELLDEVLSTS